jgi:hypothetical protein
MVNLKEKANGAIEQLNAYGECLSESSDKQGKCLSCKS